MLYPHLCRTRDCNKYQQTHKIYIIYKIKSTKTTNPLENWQKISREIKPASPLKHSIFFTIFLRAHIHTHRNNRSTWWKYTCKSKKWISKIHSRASKLLLWLEAVQLRRCWLYCASRLLVKWRIIGDFFSPTTLYHATPFRSSPRAIPLAVV